MEDELKNQRPEENLPGEEMAREQENHQMPPLEVPSKEEPSAAPKKKGTLKKSLRIVLIVLAAVVLCAVVAGAIYFENLLSLINRADDEVLETMSDEQYQALMEAMKETIPEGYEGAVMDAGDVDWGEEAETIENSDDIINILLIGQDRREGQGRSRSDTIILVTVNKPAKTLTLTSFMRDLYVQIPGRNDNRINVPYVLGGMKLLDSTLQRNFGVNVDGNIEVDFFGFIDIVELMGGIEIELTEAEANYMNENFSWDVDDGSDKNWNLTAGVQKLTGSQALSYARMRKVGNSDYQRTERQRLVLSKLIEKAKSLSVAELNLLMQHALPMITTDMDNAQILSYAWELFPMLPELQVQTLRIPVDGGYEPKIIDEMAVLVPDLWYNRVKLAEIMEIPE